MFSFNILSLFQITPVTLRRHTHTHVHSHTTSSQLLPVMAVFAVHFAISCIYMPLVFASIPHTRNFWHSWHISHSSHLYSFYMVFQSLLHLHLFVSDPCITYLLIHLNSSPLILTKSPTSRIFHH